MEEPKVIHILGPNSLPLCGFTEEKDLLSWPIGHIWVRASEIKIVNCPKCKKLMEEEPILS